MCLVKKPKVAVAATEKDAAILRNPYLDGLNPILRARSGGVKSLTIRRGQPAAPNPLVLPTTPTVPTAPTSGGSGNGTTDPRAAQVLAKMPGYLGLYGQSLL